MFLFLSKLLPALIYPLGLACILMVIALVTLWKRPRVAATSLVVALTLLLVFSNGSVTTALVRSLEWQHLPADPLPKADAIVVLGGATRSQIPPRPWVDVQEAGDRPLHGARLYLEGKAPLVILSGGRLPWSTATASEAADMAEIVQAMGVPPTAIVQDPDSRNTYENAVNVKKILEQRGLQRVLLVTSAVHMPRSLLIFKKQGIEAIAAPTDFLVAEAFEPKAEGNFPAQVLELVPDADRLHYATRALKEYIGILVYRLKGWL